MRNINHSRGRPRRGRNTGIPAQVLYAGTLLVVALISLVVIASCNQLRQSPALRAPLAVSTTGATPADPSLSAASESTSEPSLAILAQPASSTTAQNVPENPTPGAADTGADTQEPVGPTTSEPDPHRDEESQSSTSPALEPAVVESAMPESTALVPTATPVSEPMPEPASLAPSVSPSSESSFSELPEKVALTGFRHMWQTWNNCGPATLAMNLSYFGSSLTQAEIGAAIRTHPDDKNVNAEELAAYARQQGFAAQARVNGDGDLIRRFISQGIPVLIETWLEPEPGDGFGHYRLLTGYDDATQRWIAHDSYVGENPVNPNPESYAGIYLSYDETDRLWAVYNRTYVLIYSHEQASIVQEILGAQADPAIMWQEALARAQQAVAEEETQTTATPFAWFNLGSSLYHLGRAPEAAAAFDQARAIGLPWRMLWYQFEPFAAYHAVGRYQDVVDLARATLATTRDLEEVQYWYGMGLAALGDTQGARQAWEYALALKPGYVEAREALEGHIGN